MMDDELLFSQEIVTITVLVKYTIYNLMQYKKVGHNLVHIFKLFVRVVVTLSSWHVTIVIWREVITELSVMKIYLNSHKQRLGVTFLSARLLSLGTLPPSRGRPSCLGPHSPSSLKHSYSTAPFLLSFHVWTQ